MVLLSLPGFRLVNDSELWSRISRPQSVRPAGLLSKKQGGVRHRFYGTMAWHDLWSDSETVYPGDAVHTARDGRAELDLLHSRVRASVEPNSLVLIQAPPEELPRGSLLQRFLRPFVAPERRALSFELQKGELGLSLRDASDPVEVSLGGKRLRVLPRSASGRVTLALDSGKPGMLKMETEEFAPMSLAWVEETGLRPVELKAGQPLLAKIAAPESFPSPAGVRSRPPSKPRSQPRIERRARVQAGAPELRAYPEMSETEPGRLRTLLWWNELKGAVGYDVVILAKDGALRQRARVQAPPFEVPEAMLRQEVLEFEVTAMLSGGAPPVTSPRVPIDRLYHFPLPYQPSDGGQVSGKILEDGLGIILSWRLMALTESYSIEVASDSEFKEILVEETVISNFYSFKPPEPSGRYYWRLRRSGQGRRSEWSPGAAFEIR
ncbi:MAG: hypothetical protein NDJ89_13265 [Oligoflexia bacterium]|nr:hypothetical protein [Oligoflexia bacterium]